MQPGIKLATDGFPISGRLAAAIEGAPHQLPRRCRSDIDLPECRPDAEGARHDAEDSGLCHDLAGIADGGADAIYTGPIAQAIVDKIDTTRTRRPAARSRPGKTTLADLAAYQAKRRDAGLHDVPRLLGVRHGAAVVGRHRRRAGARHSRELQPGAVSRRPRSTSRAASRLCSASTWSARPSGWPTPTATSTSPTPTSSRCRAALGTRCSNKTYLRSRAGADQLQRPAWARRSRATSARCRSGSTARRRAAPPTSPSSTATATCVVMTTTRRKRRSARST